MQNLKLQYPPDLQYEHEVHFVSEDYTTTLSTRLNIEPFAALHVFYDAKMRNYINNKTPLG